MDEWSYLPLALRLKLRQRGARQQRRAIFFALAWRQSYGTEASFEEGIDLRRVRSGPVPLARGLSMCLDTFAPDQRKSARVNDLSYLASFIGQHRPVPTGVTSGTEVMAPGLVGRVETRERFRQGQQVGADISWPSAIRVAQSARRGSRPALQMRPVQAPALETSGKAP
jgi:hypothetical protein